MTPPLVSRTVKLYRLLIRLYPVEIRRRWEPEMADTFALQMTAAWRERRWTAVLGVWYYAAEEVLQIALPLQLIRAALVIPTAALAGAATLFFGLFWILQNSLALKSLYHHTLTKLGG